MKALNTKIRIKISIWSDFTLNATYFRKSYGTKSLLILIHSWLRFISSKEFVWHLFHLIIRYFCDEFLSNIVIIPHTHIHIIIVAIVRTTKFHTKPIQWNGKIGKRLEIIALDERKQEKKKTTYCIAYSWRICEVAQE